MIRKLKTQTQETKLFAREILERILNRTYLNSSQNWFTVKPSQELKQKQTKKYPTTRDQGPSGQCNKAPLVLLICIQDRVPIYKDFFPHTPVYNSRLNFEEKNMFLGQVKFQRFQSIKAEGWYYSEYNLIQMTITQIFMYSSIHRSLRVRKQHPILP